MVSMDSGHPPECSPVDDVIRQNPYMNAAGLSHCWLLLGMMSIQP